MTVTVDLGEVRDDIAKIALSVFSRIQTGIVCPTYVDILVSDDGEDFVKISRIYSPTDSSMSNYTYAFIPEKCIRARYFRFDIAGGNREWLLIEEAAAYAHVVDAESEPMYPALELAPVNGVTHWPSDSEDYDEEQEPHSRETAADTRRCDAEMGGFKGYQTLPPAPRYLPTEYCPTTPVPSTAGGSKQPAAQAETYSMTLNTTPPLQALL